DRIVLRGLTKEPASRFPTARAMADALDEVVGSLGGCSLQAFAEESLAVERDKHDTRILRVVSGDPSAIASAGKRRVPRVDDGGAALADTAPSDPTAHDTFPGAAAIPTSVLAAEAGIKKRRSSVFWAGAISFAATAIVLAAISMNKTKPAPAP